MSDAAIVGRSAEREHLQRLVDGARAATSAVLVLQGDAGMGKTTLLRHVEGTATDFRVLSIAGVEAESTFGFSALHRLLTPVLPALDRLPDPQRHALEATFGLSEATADRFLVGLATLTLLTSIAADEPLLCVVDDLQWVDRESLEILSFVGRRLDADRIVLLFGLRSGLDSTPNPAAAIPTMHLEGLDPTDARTLLHEHVRAPVADEVVARVVARTGGSPLVIIEMANQLTPAQLAGYAAFEDVLAIGGRLEDHLLSQVRTLPSEAQTLVLVAACDASGDHRVLERAGTILGLGVAARDAVERSGLLSFEPDVAFRHPLVRSAVQAGASASDLRDVHRALAEATDPVASPDRRAWHRARAVYGLDEEVAAELERCGDAARRRGGYAAEAAFRTRASELTPDPDRRTERLLAAAQAHVTAGAPRIARDLLDKAEPMVATVQQRAHATRLRASLRALSRPGTVPVLLIEAARMVESVDHEAARDTSAEALHALAVSYHLTEGMTPADVAREVLRIRNSTDSTDSAVDLLVDGYARRIAHGSVDGHPSIRRALDLLASGATPSEGLDRWIGILNWIALDLWDSARTDTLLRDIERAQRQSGALDKLRITLEGLGHRELWHGRLAAAEALQSEATDISVAMGADPTAWELLKVELRAWQGDDARTRAMAAILTGDVSRRMGAGTPFNTANVALTILNIGQGRYQEAFESAHAVFTVDPPSQGNQILPEIIEAASRCGEPDVAAVALDRLTERAHIASTPWALGLVARCRAVMEAGPEDALFAEAIGHLTRAEMAVDLARTHLLYGEWLRRGGRRLDAREHLRTAVEMFERFGAAAFEERARMELAASGETARKRVVDTSNDITPRESQVAQLAASDATNAEIAARLFLSAPTVDYHLRNVFRKLGITSRRQLASRLETGR